MAAKDVHLSDPVVDPVDPAPTPRPLEDAIDAGADDRHHGYVEDRPLGAVTTTTTGRVHDLVGDVTPLADLEAAAAGEDVPAS